MGIVRKCIHPLIVDVRTHFRAVIRGGIVFRLHFDGLAVHADFVDFNGHVRVEHGAVFDNNGSECTALDIELAVHIAGAVEAECSGVIGDADGIFAVARDFGETGVIAQKRNASPSCGKAGFSRSAGTVCAAVVTGAAVCAAVVTAGAVVVRAAVVSAVFDGSLPHAVQSESRTAEQSAAVRRICFMAGTSFRLFVYRLL